MKIAIKYKGSKFFVTYKIKSCKEYKTFYLIDDKRRIIKHSVEEIKVVQ